MPCCYICLEEYKRPVCLPCGHIYCSECLIKAVQAIKPARTIHSCPLCRGQYSIAPINISAIPPHLRPFVTPSIRRVFMSDDSDSTDATDQPSSSSSASTSSTSDTSDELARLRSENATLRSHCNLWRRRAELHGAATLGLLDFARMVRDQAVSLAQERDDLTRQFNSLKRKLDETAEHRSQSSLGRVPAYQFTFSCPPTQSQRHSAHGIPHVTAVEASRRAAMQALGIQPPCTTQARSYAPLDRGYPEQGLGGPVSGPVSPSNMPSNSRAQNHGPEPPSKRVRQSSFDYYRSPFSMGNAVASSSSPSLT